MGREGCEGKRRSGKEARVEGFKYTRNPSSRPREMFIDAFTQIFDQYVQGVCRE